MQGQKQASLTPRQDTMGRGNSTWRRKINVMPHAWVWRSGRVQWRCAACGLATRHIHPARCPRYHTDREQIQHSHIIDRHPFDDQSGLSMLVYKKCWHYTQNRRAKLAGQRAGYPHSRKVNGRLEMGKHPDGSRGTHETAKGSFGCGFAGPILQAIAGRSQRVARDGSSTLATVTRPFLGTGRRGRRSFQRRARDEEPGLWTSHVGFDDEL